MPRLFPFRSAALTLLLLLPALPLALLCRGHTPTRFDPRNLPAWERQASATHHSSFHQRRISRLRITLKRKVS